MVKGISRRVVVVRPPDSKVFEEAFFIVREQQDATRDVLREACAVAERYLHTPRVRRYSRKRYTWVQLGLAALGGSSAVGALWAATAILGIF
mgnify:FL=1